LPRRFEDIQALRGLAALGVLLFHLDGVERLFLPTARLLPEWLAVGRCGVDLFFAISGAVMVLGCRHGSVAIKLFLYHRFSRIYPPYWIYTLLSLSVFLLPQAAFDAQRWEDVGLWASLLLWPGDGRPLLLVGWTLVHEVYFYVVFAACLALPSGRLGAGLLLWAAAVAVGDLWGPSGPLWGVVFSPFTLEFIGGALAALWVTRRGGGAGRSFMVGALLLLVGFQVVLGDDETAYGVWQRVLAFGVPGVLVVYGALAGEASKGPVMPRVLCLLGYASYSLYLSHLLVLAVGRRVWVGLWGSGDGSLYFNGGALAVLALAALVWAVLSYRWLEKPLMALARRRLS
jgi:exopolysaccharide production protein ExoZ